MLIHYSDNRGWTPIHLAAKNGHLEVLNLLLLKHSTLTRTCEIIDNDHVSDITKLMPMNGYIIITLN